MLKVEESGVPYYFRGRLITAPEEIVRTGIETHMNSIRSPHYKSKAVTDVELKALGEEHREWLKQKVKEIFTSRYVFSRGVAHDTTQLPGFIAVKDNKILGLATYKIKDSECELVTLDTFEQWKGIGTMLINVVEEEARKHECGRMWMITTNDNLDGLRFYQRRGYVICAVYPGNVEENRREDPSIPLKGNYDIDIRDEIELEKNLYCWIGF